MNVETQKRTPVTEICGKRTARFLCTLQKGHKGPHGRAYRRQPDPDGDALAGMNPEAVAGLVEAVDEHLATLDPLALPYTAMRLRAALAALRGEA